MLAAVFETEFMYTGTWPGIDKDFKMSSAIQIKFSTKTAKDIV